MFPGPLGKGNGQATNTGGVSSACPTPHRRAPPQPTLFGFTAAVHGTRGPSQDKSPPCQVDSMSCSCDGVPKPEISRQASGSDLPGSMENHVLFRDPKAPDRSRPDKFKRRRPICDRHEARRGCVWANPCKLYWWMGVAPLDLRAWLVFPFWAQQRSAKTLAKTLNMDLGGS